MARSRPIWRKLLTLIAENIAKAAMVILQEIINENRDAVDLRKLADLSRTKKINTPDLLTCITCEKTRAKYTPAKKVVKKAATKKATPVKKAATKKAVTTKKGDSAEKAEKK